MFRVYDEERRKGRKPVGKEGSEEAEPILAGRGHTDLADSGVTGQEGGSRQQADPAGGGTGASL